MIITPGAMTLGDWRAIYEGESAALDAGAWNAIDASAAAVARIVAKGAPVYGINTGFGKLASVRIADDELSILQRNIVLSHAAGHRHALAGEDRPADDGAQARELRDGRLGRAARDGGDDRSDARQGPDPRRPVARIGRRERRPCAAVAHGRGDDRRRRDRGRRQDAARRRRAGRGGPCAAPPRRSEEHTSELQSLMRISYAVFCLQ